VAGEKEESRRSAPGYLVRGVGVFELFLRILELSSWKVWGAIFRLNRGEENE